MVSALHSINIYSSLFFCVPILVHSVRAFPLEPIISPDRHIPQPGPPILAPPLPRLSGKSTSSLRPKDRPHLDV